MYKHIKLYLFVLMIVALAIPVVIVGCGASASTTTTKNVSTDTEREVPTTTTLMPTTTTSSLEMTGTVLDYFPHELGMRWTYLITVDSSPVFYWNTRWEDVDYSNHLSVLLEPKTPSTYRLTLEIIDDADVLVDGSLYPGVEVEIVADGLTVFYGFNRLFWVFPPNSDQTVLMVGYLEDVFIGEKYISKVRGTQGCTAQLLLFDGAPEEARSFKFDQDYTPVLDTLYFESSSNGKMVFVRRVSESPEYGGIIDSAFAETSIYELGKGLTYLQQKIYPPSQDKVANGIVTMTWELIDFTF